MTKYEWRVLFVSIFLAAGGLVLDFWFRNEHWFMRSGALITAIAVLFAGLELRKRLERAVPFVKERFRHERPDLVKQAKAQGLGPEAAEAAVESIGETAVRETEEEARRFYKHLLRVEVALLVTGTLIWGFGDMPIDAWRNSHPPAAGHPPAALHP